MTGYTEAILKYAADDSHTGTLEHPDGIGEVGLGAEEAGRKLAVRFMLDLTGSTVNRIRYQVFGCGYTMAACAAAAQLGEGLSLKELENWSAVVIKEHLGGLPTDREYCADLAATALRAAARSAQTKLPVSDSLTSEEEPGPSVSKTNPIFRALVDSSPAKGVFPEERHLFACLLSVAEQEKVPLHEALNLSELMLSTLLLKVFPDVEPENLFSDPAHKTGKAPEINPEVQTLLLSFLRNDTFGWPQFASLALARIIAARAAHPGHLWVAMGLFERQQLSAGIGRHLPALLAANNKGMRWKRFLFKQVCALNGGMLCKSPVCGDCSDYAFCFAPEDD